MKQPKNKFLRALYGFFRVLKNPRGWIEYKTARISGLVIAGLFGLWAGPKIASGITEPCCLVPLFCVPTEFSNYIGPLAIGIPVLLLLWIFRTYDTREKIYQDDLFKGLDNLASDNPVQVDIGVAMLVAVSKKFPSFNEIIKLAFIRRLKSCPKNHTSESKEFSAEKQRALSNRLSYAQHILRWLVDYRPRHKKSGFELNGMDWSYQEFTISESGKKIVFKELFDCNSPEALPKDIRTYYTDVSGIDFTGLHFTVGDNSGGKPKFSDHAGLHARILPNGNDEIKFSVVGSKDAKKPSYFSGLFNRKTKNPR